MNKFRAKAITRRGYKRVEPAAQARTRSSVAVFDRSAGSQELATSDSQVRALLNSGELPGMRLGGRGIWRIERTRLEVYITEGHERVQQLAASGALTGEDDPDDTDE